jgi:NhaP-type Na+/H+ or K+/H+ antiporter
VGTFICFIAFSGLTFLYLEVIAKDSVMQINGSDGTESVLNLHMGEVLLMCSLLCSTDTVAAISLIDPYKQPKLFSIVFGEGVVNDGVVIILFNTINMFFNAEHEAHEEDSLTFGDAGAIIVDFISLGISSLIFGIFCGFLTAYMLKRWRSLTVNPVSETSSIFCFSYGCYVGAELLALSGIISLLTCAVI